MQPLRAHGTQEQVEQAERLLENPVDTDRDADLLRDLGLDPDGSSAGGGMGVYQLEHPTATPTPKVIQDPAADT